MFVFIIKLTGKTDIPSIPRLQLLIEDAWNRGFDAQGRDQLSGKVHNTRKWIGATEVVAVFSSLRIKYVHWNFVRIVFLRYYLCLLDFLLCLVRAELEVHLIVQ